MLKNRTIELDYHDHPTVEGFLDCVWYLHREGPKTRLVDWTGKLHRCMADIAKTEAIQALLTQEIVQAAKEFMHHHPQCPDIVEQADGTGRAQYAPGMAVPDVDEVISFARMFNP